MKKYVYFLTNIIVHPLTIISFSLALISGRLKPLILFSLITLLHELGHILMAIILNVKVSKLTILPFGMFAKIENLETNPVYKELLIVIAGPLMYFPTLYFLTLLYQGGNLSYIAYLQAKAMALTLLLFNLIPLYPLDGGRLLHLLSSFFFTDEAKLLFYRLYFFCRYDYLNYRQHQQSAVYRHWLSYYFAA